MNRQSVLWVVVVFFGASLVFGGLNNLTEDASTGVRLAVQLVALAVILGAVVVIVRARDR